MSKRLINVKHAIELDKLRNQSRVDILNALDSDRLIESVENINSDDLELDMTPEELMYRDELIEMTSLAEDTIRYIDVKFSGEKFSKNYLLVTKVPYRVTRLLGAPDNDRNQGYVCELLQKYSDMTRQGKDFNDRFSIYSNNDYIIRQAEDVDLRIRTWRDFYMLAQAVRRVFKENRHSINYTPAEVTFSKNWNNDANNSEYMKKLGSFITLMCQTQLPEKIVMEDGTTKKIFSLIF